MDKTIRLNQSCVIGLPRCDFVFSSARSCFIAYGFERSHMEMDILKAILMERNIQAFEAGGILTPAQNVFCSKICSKIIQSQFCVVIINNDIIKDDQSECHEAPNANVNMEYGLMLGFNKYIIPFQHADQKLPFNVAGLDTVKYNQVDFKSKAVDAVDQAIRETEQDSPQPLPLDQVLASFLLTKHAFVASSDHQGSRDVDQWGAPLGFQLLDDFSGREIRFFGNFSTLRAEPAALRANLLIKILDERRAAIDDKVNAKLATETQGEVLRRALDSLQIWIVVSTESDAARVRTLAGSSSYDLQVFTIDQVNLAAEQFFAGVG